MADDKQKSDPKPPPPPVNKDRTAGGDLPNIKTGSQGGSQSSKGETNG